MFLTTWDEGKFDSRGKEGSDTEGKEMVGTEVKMWESAGHKRATCRKQCNPKHQSGCTQRTEVFIHIV